MGNLRRHLHIVHTASQGRPCEGPNFRDPLVVKAFSNILQQSQHFRKKLL